MPISRDIVDKVAKLARLGLSEPKEALSLEHDLERIVAMVDQISSANTQGITPMAHPLDLTQPYRQDKVIEPNQRDELLKLAPKAEAGLFLVPPVIE